MPSAGALRLSRVVRKDYFQEGNRVYSELNVHDAYRRALNTWAKWVDSNVNSNKTTVFFRGYSASHFRSAEPFQNSCNFYLCSGGNGIQVAVATIRLSR
jgi:hypothetical protein